MTERRLAAIMAADVVGYSRQIGLDEAGALSRLSAVRGGLTDPLIADHQGRIFKTMGDGFLAEFPSAVQALRCVMAIQAKLGERNAALAEPDRLLLRIGLHQGYVVVQDGDLLGDGVNVAARLEALAEPGGICISGRVHEDAAGKVTLDDEDMGEQSLKNIALPMRVYRVRVGGASVKRGTAGFSEAQSNGARLSQDNPFAEPERTIIRPSPGGRRGAVPSTPASAPPPRSTPLSGEAQAALQADLSAAGLNPLVAAATPILALAVRLRSAATPPDLETLRERVARELGRVQERIGATELPTEAKRAGFYAICATIDDVVSNTPWGSDRWQRQAMVPLFFKEASGGERFFSFLTQFHKDPGRFGDVLEAMYLCLSLGFEGRLRVAGGAAELHRIREGLYNTLRQRRGTVEREVAPRWRGVTAPYRPLTSFLPGWVIALCAIALATAAYVGFFFAANNASDGVYDRFAALPPRGSIALQASAPAPPPVITDGILARLKTFLAPEVRDGLVTLAETPRTVTIRMRGQEMFDSGSASVRDTVMPLLTRLATALDTEPGAVQVVGHTDNVPIRSLRFPSNFHLSTARAQAVSDLLKRSLQDPKRLSSEGRADGEPLVDNDTPANRALNRRIELILTKQGTAS